MTTIVDDIRSSLTQYNQDIEFSHGRPLDTALSAVKLKINNYLVCLDTIPVNGTLGDRNRTGSVAISWLKLDKPDSHADKALNQASVQSMEEIAQECDKECMTWANTFADTYSNKYSFGPYNGFPAYRVKNMLTGFVITFQVTYKFPTC